MTHGYLMATAAGLTVAAASLLYAFAARNPERYNAEIFGPALVTSLAGFLASLVWWFAAHTTYRVLKLHLYEPASAADLAQVTMPALWLAVTHGLIGLFSWWLPDLLEWRRKGEQGDSSAG